jgi:hypothetical protein
MSAKTEPSEKIAAKRASVDKELLDHLTAKAVKTGVWGVVRGIVKQQTKRLTGTN